MVREPAKDREVSMDEADQEDETATDADEDRAYIVSLPDDECFSKLETDAEKEQYVNIMTEMSYKELYLHDYDTLKDKDTRMVARWARRQQRSKKNHALKMQAVDRENAKWDRYDNDKRYSLYRFWLKKKSVLIPYLVTENNKRKEWFDGEKQRRAVELAEQRANF